jgi:protein-disulfide isomerase
MSFASTRSVLLWALLLGATHALPAAAGKKPKVLPVAAPTATGQLKITPELEKQVLEIIRRHPEVVVESVQKYAAEQEKKEKLAQAAALQKLRQNTAALIGESPTMGAIDRKIVLLEFSDFQCTFCAQARVNIKKFMDKHKGQVTLAYKHFPLTELHPEALPAAQAAWAANKQGKFWEYQDELFTNQKQLSETFYITTAQKLKLNLVKFNTDRKMADQLIVQDFKLGRQLGVNGTPSFVMNGEFFSGVVTVEELEKILAKVQKK